jgi:carboxypeptidase C (cathepsin A)
MYGLFVENGPFHLSYNSDGGVSCSYIDEPVGQSWAYNFNMLFIDNPA